MKNEEDRAIVVPEGIVDISCALREREREREREGEGEGEGEGE